MEMSPICLIFIYNIYEERFVDSELPPAAAAFVAAARRPSAQPSLRNPTPHLCAPL